MTARAAASFAKKAHLDRLQRKGLTLPSDKASLRAIATEAAASHPIRKLPDGPRPEPPRRGYRFPKIALSRMK